MKKNSQNSKSEMSQEEKDNQMIMEYYKNLIDNGEQLTIILPTYVNDHPGEYREIYV